MSGLPLHLIQRGNNRSACFFADEDYWPYLHHLEELSHKFGCAIHAYVLMANHVHLLLTAARQDSPSLLMKHLGQRYVQYVNRTYRRRVCSMFAIEPKTVVCPLSRIVDPGERNACRVQTGRVILIQDGDKLTVLVAQRRVKVRLADIDAPDSKQPFGTRSRQLLWLEPYDSCLREHLACAVSHIA